MARKKSNNFINVFKIFFSSIRTYFLYFDQTTKALLFPVFGQIITIALLLTLSYLFNHNYDSIKGSCAFLESDKNMFILFFVILVPILLVMVKAIYDYIIAFASLNLLFFTSGKKNAKKIDFNANNNVIQRKLFNYIVLMFLTTLIFMFFVIPPLIIVLPIVAILLSLTFQVFALEGNVSPMSAIKRSVDMTKSNFIPTLLLIILCTLVTYIYLPAMFIWACEKTSFYYFLLNNCEKFVNIMPLNDMTSQLNSLGSVVEPIKEMLAPLAIARQITEGTISFVIIGFTLPFRCCCFTELYKLYDSEKIKENSKSTDEIIKRATSSKGKN